MIHASASDQRLRIANMLRDLDDHTEPHATLAELDITAVLHYEPFPNEMPPQSITVLTVGGDENTWRMQIRAYLSPDLGAELVAARAEDIASKVEDLLTSQVGQFGWEFGWNNSLSLFVAALSCSVGREDFWRG